MKRENGVIELHRFVQLEHWLESSPFPVFVRIGQEKDGTIQMARTVEVGMTVDEYAESLARHRANLPAGKAGVCT